MLFSRTKDSEPLLLCGFWSQMLLHHSVSDAISFTATGLCSPLGNSTVGVKWRRESGGDGHQIRRWMHTPPSSNSASGELPPSPHSSALSLALQRAPKHPRSHGDSYYHLTDSKLPHSHGELCYLLGLRWDELTNLLFHTAST